MDNCPEIICTPRRAAGGFLRISVLWCGVVLPRSRAWANILLMKIKHNRKTFTLIDEHGSATHPIEDLRKRLDYYRRAQLRFPNSVNQYDEIVAALEKLAKQIRA